MRINGPLWPSPFSKSLVRLNPDTSLDRTIPQNPLATGRFALRGILPA